MTKQKQGRYIVLEGNDGTGKTTQASLLYYRLATAGVPMCGFILAEPGELYRLDSPDDALAFPQWKPEMHKERCIDPSARAISCLIKDKAYAFDPQTRLLLHTAAHRAAWQNATQKALAQGLTVIATRNWLSALAYQGYGDGVDKKVIETVTRDLVGKAYLGPDATLVLMYDNEQERFQRIHNRGDEMSVHEEKANDFQRRVNAGYRAAVKQYNLQAVDADASVDDIHERMWQHVAPLFELMNRQLPMHHQPANSTADKIARFIRGGGTRKLYVVLDFDHTLVKLSTYDVLQRHLPEVGQRQYATLYEHYRSRDASGSLSADEAALWTSSILDLLTYYRVNLADIEADIVDQAAIQPHVATFFSLCDELDIPIVIVSGGVQNVIDIWCKSHGISPALVLANKLIVDKEGCVTGWNKETLIHPLNKHETSHPDLTAITSNKPYAILVGDSLNDWNMAHGEDTVLRIFVHSSPLDSKTKQAALKRFDIALGADAFNTVSHIIEDIHNGT